jgi:hypothetical protein
VVTGNYKYRLKQIDYDGGFAFSETIKIKIPINNYFLSQNYPNPANPTTNILYSVPFQSMVKINLYSVRGEVVKEILDEEKQRGIYSINVDLSNYASGIYFYRMITNKGFLDVKKMILLK